MRRDTAHAIGLLALSLGIAPACFWEGRSGLDAAAFSFLEIGGGDASVVYQDAGPLGACSSAADQAVLQSETSDFDAEHERCSAECFAEDDIAGCTADCITAATGLSAGCAGCYGADTACTIVHCIPDCIQPDSAACLACRDTHCIEAFEACVSGHPMPDAGPAPDAGQPADAARCTDAVPADSADAAAAPDAVAVDGDLDAALVDSTEIVPGACVSSADQAVLADPEVDVEAAVSSCGAGCFGQEDVGQCTSDCVATATGLSAACAGCFGADTACTITYCLAECMQPDSEPCLTCRDTYCAAAFEACVFGQPAPDAGSLPDGSQLVDAACCTDVWPADAADAAPAPDAGVADSGIEDSGVEDSGVEDGGGEDGAADAAPEDGGVVAPGACVNGADQGVLADPDVDVQAAVSSCGAGCFGQEDVGQCTGDCVATTTGLSAACAACFGEDTACTVELCFTECLAPQSDACLLCRSAMCAPAFETCAFGSPAADAGVGPDAQCCPDAAVEDGPDGATSGDA